MTLILLIVAILAMLAMEHQWRVAHHSHGPGHVRVGTGGWGTLAIGAALLAAAVIVVLWGEP